MDGARKELVRQRALGYSLYPVMLRAIQMHPVCARANRLHPPALRIPSPCLSPGLFIHNEEARCNAFVSLFVSGESRQSLCRGRLACEGLRGRCAQLHAYDHGSSQFWVLCTANAAGWKLAQCRPFLRNQLARTTLAYTLHGYVA